MGAKWVNKAQVRWVPLKDKYGTVLAGAEVYVVKGENKREPLGWANGTGLIAVPYDWAQGGMTLASIMATGW